MSHAGPRPPPPQTGHVHGGGEVFARTPVMLQLETQSPGKASFLASRGAPPVPGARDACTEAAAQHAGRAEAPNLWPCLQSSGSRFRG